MAAFDQEPLYTIVSTDNKGVQQVASSFQSRSRRKQLRTPYYNIYRLVTTLLRTAPATIERVRSHVGIRGNELADQLAKAGADPSTTTLQPDTHLESLAIDTLYDMCKLEVAVSFETPILHELKPWLTFTTRRSDHMGPHNPRYPAGSTLPFIREHTPNSRAARAGLHSPNRTTYKPLIPPYGIRVYGARSSQQNTASQTPIC
jgi:hypothetical protein